VSAGIQDGPSNIIDLRHAGEIQTNDPPFDLTGHLLAHFVANIRLSAIGMPEQHTVLASTNDVGDFLGDELSGNLHVLEWSVHD
jgi:hypothetical protein